MGDAVTHMVLDTESGGVGSSYALDGRLLDRTSRLRREAGAVRLELKTKDGKAILDSSRGTISVDGQGGAVRGAVATVDTAGAIDKRITATRIVLAGPFALAWRKKKDQRELYLLVEGETFSAVAQIDSKQGMEARKFAAAVNTASKKTPGRPPASALNGRPSLAAGEMPDYVGQALDVAFKDAVQLKLGMPKLVDDQGNKVRAYVLSNWKVVGQSGNAHSLVFKVEKSG